MREISSKSTEETIRLGINFSKKLKGGEIICLQGDLGSGKTYFTKGIAEGLGINDIITSPTFILMKNYQSKRNLTLCHLDLYRINDYKDLECLDIDDIIENPNCITIIEWAEKIKKYLPKNSIWINFIYIDNNTRIIQFI